MIASELLDRIVLTYANAKATYRDRLLECGKLALEYVQSRDVIYLEACREVDRRLGKVVCPDHRTSNGFTSSPTHVLIGCYVLVNTMGNPGTLCFGALRWLRGLMRFDRKTATFRKRKGPSWRKVYQQAVAENWVREEAKVKMAVILGTQRKDDSDRKRNHNRKFISARRKRWADAQGERASLSESQIGKFDLVSMSATASPGDVADMIVDMVEASANPRAVAEKVLPKLLAIKQREAVTL